jgi:hypothetical protein
LCQVETTPLVIDSPTEGIFTSVAMPEHYVSQSSVAVEMRFVNRYGRSVLMGRMRRSREYRGSNRKRVGDETGLLALVASKRANGRAGAGFTSGVRDFAAKKRA